MIDISSKENEVIKEGITSDNAKLEENNNSLEHKDNSNAAEKKEAEDNELDVYEQKTINSSGGNEYQLTEVQHFEETEREKINADNTITKEDSSSDIIYSIELEKKEVCSQAKEEDMTDLIMVQPIGQCEKKEEKGINGSEPEEQSAITSESQENQEENKDEKGNIVPIKKKSHYFLWFMLIFFILCAGSAGYIYNEARLFLQTPPSLTPNKKIIFIKPGMTLAQISEYLEKEKIVLNSFYFQIMTQLKKKGTNIQAGRFLVSTGWLPEKVLEMLLSGKAMLYRLTLREGLPWWSVAKKLGAEGFCREEDFSEIIRDAAFLQHWGIPFSSAEGFLFPETYFLQKPEPENMNKEAAKSIANRLVETFWKNADTVWKGKRPSRSELQQLVILASIVEKETSVSEERARVAGVYTNRLKINMLLQADPTVIYGLGQEFSGPLLKKHLVDSSNPYNTYQKLGLPPGPICSFGLKALTAAYSPEKHDFLYFVATGRDRGHTFSKTLIEHNRAVQEYRRTQNR